MNPDTIIREAEQTDAEAIFKAIRRHNWNHAEFVLLLAAVGSRADEISGMEEVSQFISDAEAAMDEVYAPDADDLAAVEEIRREERQGERV